MSLITIMLNNRKEQKNQLNSTIIIVISVSIILILIIFGVWYTQKENFTLNENESLEDDRLWEMLDNFEDFSINCGFTITDDITSKNFESALLKLKECKNETSSILVKLNQIQRENPSNELDVAKIDIQQTYNLFIIYEYMINNNLGYYTFKEEYYSILNECLRILNKIIDAQEIIETQYNDTDYYKRYYLSKINEIEEGKEELILLKETLLEGIEQIELQKE